MNENKTTTYQRFIGLQSTLRNIFLIISLATSVLVVVWTRDGIGPGGKVLIIFLAFTLLMIWMNKRGNSMVAGFCYFGVTLLMLVYFLIKEDGLYNIPVIGFPILIIFGGIILGRKIIPVITTIVIGLVIFVYSLQVRGVFIPFDGKLEFYQPDIYVAVGILLASGAILMVLLGIIEKNLDELIESEQMLNDTYDRTLSAWAKALEMRKCETPGHSQRLHQLALMFGNHLGFEDEYLADILRGVLLHDIGKIGIPDNIILKPGPLTDEEFALVKQHPLWAEKVISDSSLLNEARNIALYHHERWDGQGYPNGLVAKEIPYSARFFTILDHWDSLTHEQNYRKAWSEEEAKAYMQAQSALTYDPQLLDAFFEALNKVESAHVE
jgi:hypothetical protein